MLRFSFAAAAFLIAATSAQARPFSEMFPGAGHEPAEVREILQGFDYQQGPIVIGGGLARLNVRPGYYFLDAENSRTILEVLWGNPEDEGTLGMLFPASMTPWDDGVWGVEIRYDDIGYVSDEDVGAIDYAELLAKMQVDTREGNEKLVQQGYDPVELIGWAKTPYYDLAERKLHWAQELRFGDAPANTLNYNIRILGRKGVLVMNFIADIEALPAVENAAPDLLAMADFAPGQRYADFDPSVDEVAAIGIGGLIAGKAAAKAGLLAAALLFLKKFWLLLMAPVLIAWKKIAGRRNAG